MGRQPCFIGSDARNPHILSQADPFHILQKAFPALLIHEHAQALVFHSGILKLKQGNIFMPGTYAVPGDHSVHPNQNAESI